MSNIQPTINVTPLIDVLLVLLIIFMVISPAKPTDFKTKVPQQPKYDAAAANPDTLLITVDSDLNLRLNKDEISGSADNADKLTERLVEIFRARTANQVYSQNRTLAADEADKIEKTVFIKAPRSIGYGKVVRVIDAVKIAGARPISLQIDDLN